VEIQEVEIKGMDAFRTLRRLTGFASYVIGKDVVLPMVERDLITRQRVDAQEIRPVFIIGPPRTGSTLLYELMVSAYQVSYFSNLASLFFKSPVLVTKVTQRLGLKYRFSGSSTLGYIKGLCAPSEAGPIYNYWFGHPLENCKRFADSSIARNTIGEIKDCMGGPFVSKNLNNSLRLTQLTAVFPKAVFLYIKREPIFTAQSIILTRRRFLGSDDGWFSVKPPNYEELVKLPPFEQVAWQIRTIEDLIEEARSELKIKGIIETRYSSLVANWKGELDSIAKQCRSHGVDLAGRNTTNVIVERRDKRILTNTEWQRLKDILREIYATDSQ
jgi:LPS sulfotransferase NodH